MPSHCVSYPRRGLHLSVVSVTFLPSDFGWLGCLSSWQTTRRPVGEERSHGSHNHREYHHSALNSDKINIHNNIYYLKSGMTVHGYDPNI